MSGQGEYEAVEVRMLWPCGYWDGPLSGVCMHDESIHWFQSVHDESVHPRAYTVHPLTPEQVTYLVTNHLLFEQYVGTHLCHHYTADGGRPEHVLRAKGEDGCWGSFYKRERPVVEVPTLPPVGVWKPHGEPMTERCPDCGGSGELGSVQDDVPCPKCEGWGWMEPTHTSRREEP